jgi:TatD DNase family protein
MIDSHCHLYSSEFDEDVDSVIIRALETSVTKFYFPAIDSGTHQKMIDLETKYPGKCFSMMGLHPCSVKENFRDELVIIEDWLATRSFAAIGETGLDFYWDQTFVKQQYKALEQQIEWALKYDVPLVLHTRNALQETIDVIKNYSSTPLRGIFHCFGGTALEASQVIDAGFLLGIGGVLTYKNSGLAEVLTAVDLKHMVLETDAPYLTPVPFRGKRNESSYLPYIVTKLAEVKNTTVEIVDAITSANAEKLFSIPEKTGSSSQQF